MRRCRLVALAVALLLPQAVFAAESFAVQTSEIADQKAVIGTVEPAHQLVARARIGGTIAVLKAREGEQAAAGAELATVADQKLVLQMQALDSRIESQQSQRDQAKTDFDRVQELQRRGVSTQAQVDLAKTNLDVAERTLTAMRTDRSVIVQQMSEGAVLAPAAGRILGVPVSEGQVVLPGETIATLAEDRYILRLQLPERHAQFMRAGDVVLIGARGPREEQGEKREGRVRIVYPEIRGGRVIADVDVSGLGDYFVGERTRVYVSTGLRRAIIVPAAYVYRRAGVSYVRLADGSEVVVQPGAPQERGVEILSGLKDGDTLVSP
ncbi:MAG: efflux RND transporter periplasmic adaptor subunit [Roseiarcus sp.]|jgi:RND family efflux transporter MFP subunit